MINKNEKYRNLGFKLTPQRLAVLEYLDGNTTHPSAEDVYNAVAEKFPTMSFATVYNTLETLKQHGKLIELTSDPYKKRFDPSTEPHHHLICTECRRIVDVHQSYKLSVPDRETSGFEITGSHIEFYGICPSCRKT